MGNQKMQNQDRGLLLSSEVKPRLKWTTELHQRFVEAVAQLGGEEKATPKNLMRVMCIPGLTLYHLKSHLQKYRLGKNQQSEICTDNNGGEGEIDYRELKIRSGHVTHVNGEIMVGPGSESDESLHIAQALQVQMEVQKKLHEQIEVQKHLQLRIEAQGKYLHSILMKAQDTLTGYNSSSTMRTQFSESIETRNQSSSLSDLTETEGFSLIKLGKKSIRGMDCSLESSLTSSESSGKKDEKQKMVETGEETHEYNKDFPLLPLMEIAHSGRKIVDNNESSSDRIAGKKRSNSSISDDTSVVEQPLTNKKSTILEVKPIGQFKSLGLFKELDLNCKYQSEIDSDF